MAVPLQGCSALKFVDLYPDGLAEKNPARDHDFPAMAEMSTMYGRNITYC